MSLPATNEQPTEQSNMINGFIKADNQTLENYAELYPELSETLTQNAQLLQKLNLNQINILFALLSSLASGIKLTDTELAEKTGCNESTIYRSRMNPHFGAAIAAMTRDVIRAQTSDLVQGIREHGKRDWKANKFLMEYTGEYIARSQNMNININKRDGLSEVNSPERALDEMLVSIGKLGITLDRIAERFIELKNNGAF